MEGTYKIFNGDAVLHIIAKFDLNNYKNSGFSEIKDIAQHSVLKIPNKFLRGEKESFYIVTDNCTQTYERFKAPFKYIKAAGGVVFNEFNEILTIFRLKKYDLPKGKCEKGESTLEAAIREVEEECGVSGIRIKKELPSTFHMYKLKGNDVLKRTYWYQMEVPKQNLTPQTEENITNAQWMSIKNLDPFIQNTYPALLDLLKQSELLLT